MASLKETAQVYESKAKTKNIVELPKVSVALTVETKKLKTKEGEDFEISYIVVDGEEYRIPVSVLSSLKMILEDNPNLKEFKVKKTGTGMDTNYLVIPLA